MKWTSSATFSPASLTGPATGAKTPAQASFSDRETEVLALVARGSSNKEIAQELFLSKGTVKAHISHIMAKVGAERRADLVRFAVSSGIVPLSDEGFTNQ